MTDTGEPRGRWWTRRGGSWIHRAIGWVVLPVAGGVLLAGGIHSHVDSEAFHGGASAQGVFTDTQEHTSYTRSGAHHSWSGDLEFLTPGGQQYTVDVSAQPSELSDGDTGTVSYRPSDPAHGRWVHDDRSADESIALGSVLLAGFAGYGGLYVRHRRRPRRSL